MRRKKYYLHTRNSGIFYAELVDPATGLKLSARSTGKDDRDEALLVVAEWLRMGIPIGRGEKSRPVSVAFELEPICIALRKASLDPDGAERIVEILKGRGLIVGNFVKAGTSSVKFLDFLHNSWDPRRSAFLNEKAAYGHPLTKRHTVETDGVVKRYWECKPFNDILLSDVTRTMLKDHLIALSGRGFAPATLNKILAAVSAPLNWAERERIIPESPAKGIPRFSGETKARDILSSEEIEALVALDWPDERALAAFLVALTCGLRLSEVQALRVQDIADDRLLVRHSWSWADGLTGLKNKEAREVRILPEVRDALRELVAGNPHGVGELGFVFYGMKPDQPLDTKPLTDGYFAALRAIGIDEETRKARNLVFHGLRHNYAVALSERVSEAQAMKSTGHRSGVMFQHYAGHQTEEALSAVGAAVDDAFGRIVRFRRAVIS